MANKQYFTRLEMLEDLKEAITDFDIVYYDDVAYETFDVKPYITGTREAEKALEQYGTFKAIGEVKHYEIDNYGRVFTKLDNPVSVANQLYYILGEDTLQSDYPELSDAYYSVLDCEVNDENDKILLDVIDKLIDDIK